MTKTLNALIIHTQTLLYYTFTLDNKVQYNYKYNKSTRHDAMGSAAKRDNYLWKAAEKKCVFSLDLKREREELFLR